MPETRDDTAHTQTLDEAKHEAAAEGGTNAPTEEAVHERSRLRAVAVYEIIRREGSGEIARGFPALFWSGIAAGLSIGLSIVSEALLMAHLPDAGWRPLVENFGYTVGFVIVIMSRQQLFTENTLTAVMPVMMHRTMGWLLALLRLWSIVLTANLLGCFLFAVFLYVGEPLKDEVRTAVLEIGRHLMGNSPSEMFIRGIAAGWLIAALVWMLPSAEGNEFLVIVVMTYLIALGDFTHVVAGSAEVFFLILHGETSWIDGVFGFLLPTLAGNIVGGTFLFGLLSYAQVREEIAEMKQADVHR